MDSELPRHFSFGFSTGRLGMRVDLHRSGCGRGGCDSLIGAARVGSGFLAGHPGLDQGDGIGLGLVTELLYERHSFRRSCVLSISSLG